jgi:uncharacterized RDD family membrane protein YckC
MAKLILNPTSSSRREISLSRSLVSIGRDPSNDLVLPDAMVSRRHAVIEFRASQYFLRDCNSSNGSLVNGDRVSERNLRDGDLVAIGTARILFKEEAQEAGAKVVQHPSAPRQQCPTCGSDYRKGDAFCRNCGGQLAQIPPKVICTACGTVVPLPAKFCYACGGPLGAAQGISPGEGAPPAVEPAPDAPAPPIPEAAIAAGEEVGPQKPPESPRAVGAAIGLSIAERVTPVPTASPLDLPLKPSSVPLPAPAPKPWAEPRPPRLEPRTPSPDRPARKAAAWREAEVGPRFVAAVIDGGIVLVGELLLMAPLAYYWTSRRLPSAPEDVHFAPVLLSVSLVLLVWALGAAYFVYYWGVKGTTPGKAAAGLEIRGTDGRFPVGLSTAFARLFGYLVSTALLGVGFLLVLFGKEALHDKIAGTRVVRRERG